MAIFVFGSNLAGRHVKGAALFAKCHYGAISGQGIGRQGESYAIPTKDHTLKTLPLSSIRYYVDQFLEYAASQGSATFKVSRIGCGLAGYDDADIAPLFAGAPNNVDLPYRWERILGQATRARIIVAGSRTITQYPPVKKSLSHVLKQLQRPIIVSGHAQGPDRLGERYAHECLDTDSLIVCPAQWDKYGKAAEYIRNVEMARISSHLMAFYDGQSKGTKHMINIAKNEGMPYRIRKL